MQQKPNGSDSDFSFAIKRHIGVLSTTPRGWTKELNLVSIMAAAASLISACGVRTTRRWAKESPWYGKKPISFTPF